MKITGEVTNQEPNRIGRFIASALRKGRDGLNKVTDRPLALPTLRSTPNVTQGFKLGDALMGQAPEEMERISYGDLPMQIPEMSNIPSFKTGRKQPTADLALTALDAVPVANVAHKAAGRAVSKGLQRAADGLEGSPLKSAALEAQSAVTGGGLQSNVIKPKGGDWAPGAIDFMIDALRKNVVSLDDPVKDAAVDKWLNSAMRKYMANDMGTMEDPVRKVHSSRPENPYANNRGALTFDEYNQHVNTTPDGPRRTPRRHDDRRASNTSRFDAQTVYDHSNLKEGEGSFVVDKVEDSESGASIYEDMVDRTIIPRHAQSVREDYNHAGEEIPAWLAAKADNDVMMDVDQYDYGTRERLSKDFQGAGLASLTNILVDELRQGKIRPESLNKVSVESLAQKALSRAVNEPEAISKQYSAKAEPYMGMEYPDGFKWVEVPADYKQLASEGDIMGHCVGGYCSYVEKGIKKIISLRDARGMPKVTVDAAGNMRRSGSAVKEAPENPGNISQIMGQGNRYPEEFMPYINDFLRKSRPDSVGIEHRPVDRPNPTDKLKDEGLDIDLSDLPMLDEDRIKNNAAYGVVDKQQILDNYDPFGVYNLNERLDPLAIDRGQGQFMANEAADLLRRNNIEKQQLTVSKDHSNYLYEQLLEGRHGLDLGNQDQFFRRVNTNVRDIDQFRDDMFNLQDAQRDLRYNYNEQAEERRAYFVDRIQRRLNGEDVTNPDFDNLDPPGQGPQEYDLDGGLELRAHMDPVFHQFEAAVGVNINPNVLANEENHRRMLGLVQGANAAVERQDNYLLNVLIDRMRELGFID